MSGLSAFLAMNTLVASAQNPVAFPAARFVVVAVPCAAILFYLLVVRRHRDQ
jgi:hypothetical protein